MVAIIAEGIPENMTRKMNKLAKEKGVTIIGPATVGGIKPGCFKIGTLTFTSIISFFVSHNWFSGNGCATHSISTINF